MIMRAGAEKAGCPIFHCLASSCRALISNCCAVMASLWRRTCVRSVATVASRSSRRLTSCSWSAETGMEFPSQLIRRFVARGVPVSSTCVCSASREIKASPL